jgi:hypothetical protein
LPFQIGSNFASFIEISLFVELPVTLGKCLFLKKTPKSSKFCAAVITAFTLLVDEERR